MLLQAMAIVLALTGPARACDVCVRDITVYHYPFVTVWLCVLALWLVAVGVIN